MTPKRLYLFDPAAAPKEIRGLVGGKIREKLITENWPRSSFIGTPNILAAQLQPEGAKVSTVHQTFWRISHRLDGPISCSQENTGGKIDDALP